MKKNTMMRVASVLLVAVLLSTCVISSTFAKYVTESTGSDNARVAYWGWTAPASMTIDLFDANYDNGQVMSADQNQNVIAPGTSKTETFGFRYTNYRESEITAPEVAYSFVVSVETTGSNVTHLDDNPNFKWTLDDTMYDTLEQLEAAIEALDGNESFEAGVLPDEFGQNATHTIGWIWLIDETDNANDWGAVNGDAADTAMGNAATLENVYIEITITATQED